MTYNSKRALSNMAAGSILMIAYIIHAIQKNAQGVTDLKSWAITMLLFIGIGIVAAIVIQILFHIAYAIGVAIKERQHSEREVERIISASVVEDERDKLINLKMAHIGYIVAGAGFITALVSLTLGYSAILALHIVLGAFAIGSLVEGAGSIYFYERGVHNG